MPETIQLAIRSLCEFLMRSGSIDARFSGIDRAVEGARIHRMLQKQGGKGYKAEVPLSANISFGGMEFCISGRADGVISSEDGIIVDEIKTTAADMGSIEDSHNKAHWAQGCCYAYIICKENSINNIKVRLTYFNIDTGDIKRFEREYTIEELDDFINNLLAGYLKWASMEKELAGFRDRSLTRLKFPFGSFRKGQRNLAAAVYITCRDSGRLFACAPTGIGKTLSVLFPALKAMGEGYGERIFYLTAKTVTGYAAENALSILREQENAQLNLRSILITAKDKVCMLEQRQCYPETCRWAEGYYDRINDSVYEILQEHSVFSREALQQLAGKYKLCPYELSLDLAQWCDVIICDYNYLFDPVVHLQRFFEGRGGDNIFLIDEAHNLLDRARDMYSAKAGKAEYYDFKKQLPKKYRKMHKALAAVNKEFVAIRKICEEEQITIKPTKALPEDLVNSLYGFTDAAKQLLEDLRGADTSGDVNDLEEKLLELYFETVFFLKVAEMYGENYTTMLTQYGKDIRVQFLCLDPSFFLAESMDKGRAAVLFSATLHPIPYYMETLGGGDTAKQTSLTSPFNQNNLGLFVAGSVSTKYSNRATSLNTVTKMIADFVKMKQGNYIAFFPSYSYMRQAVEVFEAEYPDISIIVQQPGMDDNAREEFLLEFDTLNKDTLLGFCVMGGVFGEGVDLVGDRLIGAVIVGVGLPQIGPSQDELRNYWDAKSGNGFDYAYRIPGMNKVMQAAGRVIRGENETGAVLLIDDRFVTSFYQNMFPAHWSHWQYVDEKSLAEKLENYWNGVLSE